MGKTLTFGSTKEDKKEGLLKRLANINKANDLYNLRYINTNIYQRDIDYYCLNKDKFDTRRFYKAYNKLESLEEKFFMINEFYKKIENFKNDDNILSDDINKKTLILNNTSKVYNNLLNRYKDEYSGHYKKYNEELKKKYDYKNFNDLTDDNEEPKYEESIAERTKMRRKNKESDNKDILRLLPYQILTVMIYRRIDRNVSYTF